MTADKNEVVPVPAGSEGYGMRRYLHHLGHSAAWVRRGLLTTQVFLPSGVLVEAGRLIEDGLTGTVTFEAGKRLTPEDLQALCGALSG